MNDPWKAPSSDVTFNVPQVHRLRFLRGAMTADRHLLAELLEPSEGQTSRVQFWLDANVAAAQPTLLSDIRKFAAEFAHRLTLAGAPEIVPGGEAVKNDIHALQPMLAKFAAAGLDRRSYVVVVGGGAVLDAVGFAAAMAHRGLRLVRLPTTTLAQADSGVGVKNGVNLFRKKNWLGTFTAPWAVVNDALLLETLSERDFIAGFSEAVKVAMLKDRPLFEGLCATAPQIRGRDMAASLPMIRRSAELHRDHITRGGDPYETFEARPLDFGHWSAHKLEAMTDFELRHGEAVAIGVAIDTVYSSLAIGLDPDEATRVLACLVDLGFPLEHPQLGDLSTLLGGIEEFRQHLGGRLTLTMLRNIGEPLDIHEIDRSLMARAVDQVRHFARSAPFLRTECQARCNPPTRPPQRPVWDARAWDVRSQN